MTYHRTEVRLYNCRLFGRRRIWGLLPHRNEMGD